MEFAKDFYEKFTRKKGSASAEYTGNTVDYYIDGAKAKQKEYNAAVERALGLPLEKAKMLLVLGCFADSMKTDEKRKILFEMAGEFTDEDIFAENKDLAALKEFLRMPGTSGKSYSIDQWKQIASDGRRKLNKDLELLPARIDEAQKSLPPESSDVAALQTEIKMLEAQKEALEEEKRGLRSDDAAKAAIAGLSAEMETKRAAYIRRGAQANVEKNAAIDKLAAEIRDLDDAIYRDEKRCSMLKNDIADMEGKRQELMNEYAAAHRETWDAGQEICPACGRQLPADKVQELRAAFNQRKSERLTDINRRGQAECSQAMIEANKAEAAAISGKLEQTKSARADLAERIQNLKDAAIRQPPFETTGEYEALAQKIEDLKTRTVAGDAEAAIIQKIADTNNAIAGIMEKAAAARQAAATEERIEDLQKTLKETASNLERLEYGIHLCEEFTRAKARMVTESINRHFSRVRFILFRDQINGGLKEVCEPTCQNKDDEWVEYRSLNFADKINAQLDIVNALNKHYGANLPVIMDQGESVTNPMPVDEQFIRLIVSAEDKALRAVRA